MSTFAAFPCVSTVSAFPCVFHCLSQCLNRWCCSRQGAEADKAHASSAKEVADESAVKKTHDSPMSCLSILTRSVHKRSPFSGGCGRQHTGDAQVRERDAAFPCASAAILPKTDAFCLRCCCRAEQELTELQKRHKQLQVAVGKQLWRAPCSCRSATNSSTSRHAPAKPLQQHPQAKASVFGSMAAEAQARLLSHARCRCSPAPHLACFCSRAALRRCILPPPQTASPHGWCTPPRRSLRQAGRRLAGIRGRAGRGPGSGRGSPQMRRRRDAQEGAAADRRNLASAPMATVRSQTSFCGAVRLPQSKASLVKASTLPPTRHHRWYVDLGFRGRPHKAPRLVC